MVYCTKCRKELPDDAIFCPTCGWVIRREVPSPEKVKPQRRKTLLLVGVTLVIVVVMACLLVQFVVLPFSASLLKELKSKNISFIEAKYYPAFNGTAVKFKNIGNKILYNITVVSEFGERVEVFEDYAAELHPGQWFQVGLNGQVSKATVQYSTEPNGPKVKENFEWGW